MTADTYRITLWDPDITLTTQPTTGNWSYTLTWNGQVIFTGNDFHPGLLVADDPTRTLADLAAFLTLAPGDTDPEWFNTCTTDQLTFATSTDAQELTLALADPTEPTSATAAPAAALGIKTYGDRRLR